MARVQHVHLISTASGNHPLSIFYTLCNKQVCGLGPELSHHAEGVTCPECQRRIGKRVGELFRAMAKLGDRPADAMTCPVCEGFYMTKPNKAKGRTGTRKVVLHGYRRPGDGATHGRCYGVGFEPYEHSPAGTIAYLENVVRPSLERTLQLLDELPKVTELWWAPFWKAAKPQLIRLGEPKWESVYHDRRVRLLADRLNLQSETERCQRLIERWQDRKQETIVKILGAGPPQLIHERPHR